VNCDMQVPTYRNQGKTHMIHTRNAQKIICFGTLDRRAHKPNQTGASSHKSLRINARTHMSGATWSQPNPRVDRTWTPSQLPNLWWEDHPYLLDDGGQCFLMKKWQEPTSQAIKGGLPPSFKHNTFWRKRSRGTLSTCIIRTGSV
jgi:hypothetical protein